VGFSLGGQAGDIGLTDPDPGSVSANRTFFKNLKNRNFVVFITSFFSLILVPFGFVYYDMFDLMKGTLFS
jgi:hypothetical protein